MDAFATGELEQEELTQELKKTLPQIEEKNEINRREVFIEHKPEETRVQELSSEDESFSPIYSRRNSFEGDFQFVVYVKSDYSKENDSPTFNYEYEESIYDDDSWKPNAPGPGKTPSKRDVQIGGLTVMAVVLLVAGIFVMNNSSKLDTAKKFVVSACAAVFGLFTSNH